MKNIDLRRTYKTMIENSVDSKLFRNLYVNQNKANSTDVLNDGEYACAFYVSILLKIFNLIDEAHATVDSTVDDLEKSGWVKINNPKVGAVVVWEAIEYPGDDEAHQHIGFIVDEDSAVSIDYKTGTPRKHSHSPNSREIEQIFWLEKFNEKK